MTKSSAFAPLEPAGRRSIAAAMQLVRDELTLTPDRWSRMLRITALVTIVVIVSNASPEKLTRELLWIWVVISYPIALLVVSDLALGRRPEELFRRGISARLRAAGAFLAGDPDDDARARREFERLERMGTGDIS